MGCLPYVTGKLFLYNPLHLSHKQIEVCKIQRFYKQKLNQVWNPKIRITREGIEGWSPKSGLGQGRGHIEIAATIFGSGKLKFIDLF